MSGAGQDIAAEIKERVDAALSAKIPLNIVAGGTKSFYGEEARGEVLPVSGHRGILCHEPSELVITARAGTALSEVESVLAEHGQMLGFEPPFFGAEATLGGAIAAGLSGPRRPYAGSARDFLLGVTLVNGRGEVLRFGGTVMKNVAGFDVSRLMTGALGTLGVLLDLSIKVLPRPEAESTLVFEMSAGEAIFTMNRWAARCLPVSATCHTDGRLMIRLSGHEAAIEQSRRRLGGELHESGAQFWEDLREQRISFFADEGELWRLSVPPAQPMPDLPGSWLIEWGGALRWYKTAVSGESMFGIAAEAGGHACRFRRPTGRGPVFQPLPPAMHSLQRRLKKAFDPAGILNPGRLYADW